MTAARCPRCRRRDVRVRKDGRLAVHYVTIPVSARAVPSVGAGSAKHRCDGSEQPVPAREPPDRLADVKVKGNSAMTEADRTELARLQAFIDVLGVSEMDDRDFDRYLALCKAEQEGAGRDP